MKYLLTLFTLLFYSFSFAQIAEFGNLSKNNQSFQEYKSKNGDIIKVGDTLTIGKGLDPLGFRFISQGGGRMHVTHGGKDFVITKIKSYGKAKSGFTIWLNFKGFGLLPVEVDYENALEAGEVINPQGTITRAQAIEKLKESKELLDLEIITQEDYDKVKEEMTKFIK